MMKWNHLGIILIILIAGCTTNANNASKCSDGTTCNLIKELPNQAQVNAIEVDKIEVFHFHGTNQCYSCKTVGAYAEETVNTYFSKEVKQGLIVFDSINGDLTENVELVKKYGATGSSLWIGVYDDNGFHAEQNVKVWYKISDKQQYMNYLKGIIEKRLAGDFSE